MTANRNPSGAGRTTAPFPRMGHARRSSCTPLASRSGDFSTTPAVISLQKWQRAQAQNVLQGQTECSNRGWPGDQQPVKGAAVPQQGRRGVQAPCGLASDREESHEHQNRKQSIERDRGSGVHYRWLAARLERRASHPGFSLTAAQHSCSGRRKIGMRQRSRSPRTFGYREPTPPVCPFKRPTLPWRIEGFASGCPCLSLPFGARCSRPIGESHCRPLDARGRWSGGTCGMTRKCYRCSPLLNALHFSPSRGISS